MILKDVVNVLRAGNALKNPEKWKKGHWLFTTVSLLVAGIAGILKWKFPNLVFDEDTLGVIIEVICYVLAFVGAYLIPATTEKPLTKKGAAAIKAKQEVSVKKEVVKEFKPWVNPNREVK